MQTIEKDTGVIAMQMATPYFRDLAATSSLTTSSTDDSHERARDALRESVINKVGATLQRFNSQGCKLVFSCTEDYPAAMPDHGLTLGGLQHRDNAALYALVYSQAARHLLRKGSEEQPSRSYTKARYQGRDMAADYGRFLVALEEDSENEAFRWITTSLSRSHVDPFENLLASKVRAALAAVLLWEGKNANARLVARIRELIGHAREEYPETEIPNPLAIQSYFSLFGEVKDLPKPVTAVAGNGGIMAHWRRNSGYALALQFLRNGSVNVAAFFLDPGEPLTSGSYSANYSWRTAARELQRNDALKWVFNASHV